MKTIMKIEPIKNRPGRAKIKVAAYCRVSTGTDEQLVSLETQKSHYEELINANPDWEFAGLYYDEGISGTSKEKRPALKQMIADCRAGKIDRILVKSLSRFARNTADCLELTRKLLDLGVTIYFEKENLDTGSMESELLLSVMSSLAESESVSMSENYKWGVRHRFENGTFKIGYAPYGYDSKDGEFTINEDEARWVRWIFSQALNGTASNAIAKQLNDLKVPSRRSGHWTATTIRHILTNEKYIGACLLQKTYTDFRFKRHYNHGEQDQFFIEGHHAAIVSQEDFDAVGELLEQRAHEKGIGKVKDRNSRRYPFSGKLICGDCGSRFRRHMNTTGSQSYPVWVCVRHLENADGCSMKFVRESDLEYAFMTMMNKLIFAKEEILHTLLDHARGETYKSNLQRIEDIDRRLKKNTERARTLTTIMSKGYIEMALFKKESNGLSAETDMLAEEKDRLIKAVTGNVQKADELSELIKYVDKAEPADSFDGDLVAQFLDHATIHSRTEITFHLKCGLSLKERM